MIIGHGGNKDHLAGQLGCGVEEIIDMSSNLNPLGPPENIQAVIRENISAIHSLPEPDAITICKGFAGFHNIDFKNVIAGNGTTWFIYTIPRALDSKKVLICGPTYSDYKDACTMHSVACKHYISQSSSDFKPDVDEISCLAENADTVFICNPNNPTGALLSREKIEFLLKKHANTCFVVDESYLPFVDRARDISFVSHDMYPNLMVLSSMSKIFRIPGLRTGFLSGSPSLVGKIKNYYQPWSVNSLAQAVIRDIFEHPLDIEPFYEKTRAYVAREKQSFADELKGQDRIRLYEGHTYFVLAELIDYTAPQFCTAVGQDKILIRDCTNFHGLDHKFVRFSLKSGDINLKLAQSIKKVLANV